MRPQSAKTLTSPIINWATPFDSKGMVSSTPEPTTGPSRLGLTPTTKRLHVHCPEGKTKEKGARLKRRLRVHHPEYKAEERGARLKRRLLRASLKDVGRQEYQLRAWLGLPRLCRATLQLPIHPRVEWTWPRPAPLYPCTYGCRLFIVHGRTLYP